MSMLRAAIITLVVTLCSTVTGYAAGEDDTAKQLADVQEQLKEAKQQNEEYKQTRAQLEKKVQCTYRQVKGYENCDKSFKKKNADYMACIDKARKEKADCMQDVADNSSE